MTKQDAGDENEYCVNPGAKCGWVWSSGVCTLHYSRWFGWTFCRCDG